MKENAVSGEGEKGKVLLFGELSEATLVDYFKLMKPGVISLVAFTGFAGMIGASVPLNPFISIVSLLCILCGAGAAGALNMWYDADIDCLMKRTAMRPLPQGRLHPDEARDFGMILAFLSVITLGSFVNWLAAGLLAAAILFYVAVYTIWLKRRTPQNIVIGGAAGALPPVIGWASVTGTVSVESFLLFMIIFLWTPPHFWALALLRTHDYERAGLPMMPNVRGRKSVQRQIFFYSLSTCIISLLPVVLGFSGKIYASGAFLSGAFFVFYAWRLGQAEEEEEQNRLARFLFRYSLVYLFAIFLLYVIDVIVEPIPTIVQDF